jgi:hypothetical protein
MAIDRVDSIESGKIDFLKSVKEWGSDIQTLLAERLGPVGDIIETLKSKLKFPVDDIEKTDVPGVVKEVFDALCKTNQVAIFPTYNDIHSDTVSMYFTEGNSRYIEYNKKSGLITVSGGVGEKEIDPSNFSIEKTMKFFRFDVRSFFNDLSYVKRPKFVAHNKKSSRIEFEGGGSVEYRPSTDILRVFYEGEILDIPRNELDLNKITSFLHLENES